MGRCITLGQLADSTWTLSQAFTEMSKEAWENAPSTTNAVERKNLDIKQKNPVDFKAAMIKSYKLDKSYCLQHIAASEKVRLSYTNATEENIQKQASKKAKQRLNKSYLVIYWLCMGLQTRPKILRVCVKEITLTPVFHHMQRKVKFQACLQKRAPIHLTTLS